MQVCNKCIPTLSVHAGPEEDFKCPRCGNKYWIAMQDIFDHFAANDVNKLDKLKALLKAASAKDTEYFVLRKLK